MLTLNLYSAKLAAYLSYSTFDNPSGTPYLETYLNVVGNSARTIKNSDGKFQSKIEVLWVFKSGDSIVKYDKYNLLSPPAESADGIVPDFISQQRVSLPNGKYEVELSIRDANTNDEAIKLSQPVSINYNKSTLQMSDIEILESISPSTKETVFTKNGYEMIPFANNFFPESMTKLNFYAEIYNAASSGNEDFLIRYYLSENNGRRILDDYTMTKREKAKKVNIILSEIPIENLPSGNYQLGIDVVSRDNKILAHKDFFLQRSNQIRKPMVSENFYDLDITNTFVSNITNIDTLTELIAVLYPISDQTELRIEEALESDKQLLPMQKFIYNFWSKRNSTDPQGEWQKYMVEVQKVNNSFSSVSFKGYRTDRGRVYLQYGPPDAMTQEYHDPDSWPYEIWQYYHLGHFNDRKFVFYNTELGTNNFRLLHSNMNGELSEPSWELILHNRSQQFGTDIDAEKPVLPYGSKTDENFANPK